MIVFAGSPKPSDHHQDDHASVQLIMTSPSRALEHDDMYVKDDENDGNYGSSSSDVDDLDGYHGYDGYDEENDDDRSLKAFL